MKNERAAVPSADALGREAAVEPARHSGKKAARPAGRERAGELHGRRSNERTHADASDELDELGAGADGADAGALDARASDGPTANAAAHANAPVDAAVDTAATAALEPGPPRVEPPYWAVIFVSKLRDPAPGYERAAQAMFELVSDQPGYLGVEMARDANGLGITISYWRAPEDFERWRDHAQHAATRELGRERWYEHYELRWARVERQVSWSDAPLRDAHSDEARGATRAGSDADAPA
ncbi:antibiotic biosynthesis monooxygenase family protein [Planctomycetes bacterium Pla163]